MNLANPRHERFARLIAEGKTLEHAYTGAGYASGGARQSAERLSKKPEVQRRITELRAEINTAITQRSIASKSARVEALALRWELLEQVRRERATDPDMQRIPGGKTGLLVRTIKSIGQGEKSEQIEEYELDRAMLAESRAHEEQAAKELGQWIDKSQRIITRLEDLTDAELESLTNAK